MDTKPGKWVTNFPNPYDPCYVPSVRQGESQEDALRSDREIWNRYIKGPPQASDALTVEELVKQGMYGLYESPFKITIKGDDNVD